MSYTAFLQDTVRLSHLRIKIHFESFLKLPANKEVVLRNLPLRLHLHIKLGIFVFKLCLVGLLGLLGIPFLRDFVLIIMIIQHTIPFILGFQYTVDCSYHTVCVVSSFSSYLFHPLTTSIHKSLDVSLTKWSITRPHKRIGAEVAHWGPAQECLLSLHPWHPSLRSFGLFSTCLTPANDLQLVLGFAWCCKSCFPAP